METITFQIPLSAFIIWIQQNEAVAQKLAVFFQNRLDCPSDIYENIHWISH